MKKCKQCNEEKPLDAFHKDRSHIDGLRTECKSCRKPKTRAYYATNSAKVKQREYSHKERRRANTLRYCYGISTEKYEQLLMQQNFGCAICHKPETKKNASNLCVDHCHKSGRIRGLLCHKCNSAIGKLGDSIELLESALAYLKYYSKPQNLHGAT